MLITAVINNRGNTLVVDLPCDLIFIGVKDFSFAIEEGFAL